MGGYEGSETQTTREEIAEGGPPGQGGGRGGGMGMIRKAAAEEDHVFYPSRDWLQLFWAEVDINGNRTVELFGRWPLLPLSTGELAKVEMKDLCLVEDDLH